MKRLLLFWICVAAFTALPLMTAWDYLECRFVHRVKTPRYTTLLASRYVTLALTMQLNFSKPRVTA